MFECERADLCDAHWMFEDTLGLEILHQELRRIDRGFEIIYDRLTALSSTHPGHHLYRRISSGGSPLGDRLVLEFSLQEDIHARWPDGIPKAPGRWVVELVKKLDKANLPGNAAYLNHKGESIEDKHLKGVADRHEQHTTRFEKGEADKAKYVGDQVHKFATLGTTSCTGAQKHLTRRQRRKLREKQQGW